MLNNFKKEFFNRKSLLGRCLALSVTLHFLALFLLYKYPLILNPSLASLFFKSKTVAKPFSFQETTLSAKEKNQVLEEALNTLIPIPEVPLFTHTSPEFETLMPSLLQQEQEWTASLKDEPAALDLDSEGPVTSDTIFSTFPWEDSLENLYTLELPKDLTAQELSTIPLDLTPSVDSIDPLLKNLSVLDLAEEKLPEVASFKTPTQEVLNEGSILVTSQNEELERLTKDFDTQITAPALSSPALQPADEVAPASALSQLEEIQDWKIGEQISILPSELEGYSLPKSAPIVEWKDNFHVELSLLPLEHEKGYFFSLTLKPKVSLDMKAIKQHFYFFIDRSISIEKHRFGVYKRAVLKALAALKEGHQFNIFVFDKKLTRLSDKCLPYSSDSIHRSEEFLERQEYNNYATSSDFCAFLEQAIPKITSENEMHTAILLTNGKSDLSFPKQQKAIKKWIRQNDGKVALYTAAVGQSNNLLLLDVLSSFSGGRMLYSDTFAAFPRKFVKLVQDLRFPIAKDVIITALSSDLDTQITLYPSSTHLPALYSDEPYQIFGKINQLSDFTLIMQARHHNEWLSIKKAVSFEKAKQEKRILGKKWSLQQASISYEKFLTDGKTAHLKEAKEFLKTFGAEVSLE